MKICAVVAEYNPFHNGHRYHLEQTRALGADAVVAVMSGSFVQRAEPAILSKFSRAQIAAQCGADLVLELPVQYATASSERFAYGAVSIAENLGCVDMLSFGSETGDIDILQRAAKAVSEERIVVRTRERCEMGESYPQARRAAVAELHGESMAAVLDSPNNLLGVDYLKALSILGSGIRPVTIPRYGAAHDGTDSREGFASASYIRQCIRAGEDIAALVPEATAVELERQQARGVISGGMQAIERLVLYRLRGMDKDQLAALPDCADGLGHRLCAAAGSAATVEELYESAKTRRYTMSRVRRAVLCAMLDIGLHHFFPPPYARILAIGPKGTEILARMKETARIPFSHDLAVLAETGQQATETARLEAAATDLYALTTEKVGPRGQDYTQKLYKVEI